MQIPILNGIYSDSNSDYRVAYPYNLIPVPKSQGVSAGYLRPAEGITHKTASVGPDRAAINWANKVYRVSGNSLISVDDEFNVTDLGNIAGVSWAKMDYSFDRLSVSSGGNLYYYDGADLSQVTDPDLGGVIDHIWVDGYFMTTDGESLVVTDLNDPFSVNPLKYGSSESDPDPVVALLKIRNEPHAINRHTIEVFSNVGGAGFPFQRIEGAQIMKGAIGTNACCVHLDAVAFIGGGRNESIAVYMSSGGSYAKVSTSDIDKKLNSYTNDELSSIKMESRTHDGHNWLFIHLPDVTLVFDQAATNVVGEKVWFKLGSGLEESKYLGVNAVWQNGHWMVGDPDNPRIGVLDPSHGDHWGNKIGWEFSTNIIYNDSNGAIFHDIELVCLTGRAKFGLDPSISTRFSNNGETWSQHKFIKAGKAGQRDKRLMWFRQGSMRHMRIQKFNGTSDSRLSISRLEARIEPLAY